MDGQGAGVVLARNCAASLGLEDQPVHLYAFGGHIEVLSEAIYEERKRAATVKPVADRAKLRQAGNEVMPYARSGDARGSDRPVGDPSRRHVSGCHRGIGRAYGVDRTAVDYGTP